MPAPMAISQMSAGLTTCPCSSLLVRLACSGMQWLPPTRAGRPHAHGSLLTNKLVRYRGIWQYQLTECRQSDLTMISADRLKGIAAFVQAADAGSFTIAAERLGLSKSGIAKSVARLEERLGVRLFNRTTR